MDDKEKLIHNERVKLTASFFNNCGVASIAGGGFTILWEISSFSKVGPTAIITQAIAVFLGFWLQNLARKHVASVIG